MGIQSNIKLRGTIENKIFYQWKGIDCIRTKPAVVRRVPVAIKNSGIFGMAANRSAILRSLLRPVVPEPGNRKVIHRVDAAFRQWLKTEPLNDLAPVDNLPYFNDLSLNEKNELSSFLRVPISISRTGDNELFLQIPAFDAVKQIKAPENTTEVILQIMIAAIAMKEPSFMHCKETSVVIPYKSGELHEQLIPLPLVTKEGQLTVISLAIHYTSGTTGTTERAKGAAWKPAGVVGSFFN